MAENFLIIDNDLDTLRLVGLKLQKQGYQFTAAALCQPENMTKHQIDTLTTPIVKNENKK